MIKSKVSPLTNSKNSDEFHINKPKGENIVIWEIEAINANEKRIAGKKDTPPNRDIGF